VEIVGAVFYYAQYAAEIVSEKVKLDVARLLP